LEPTVDPHEAIRKEIGRIRIIDTHEHLVSEQERVATEVDPLSQFFLHYASSDLVSAGMSREELDFIRDPNKPLEKRWERFAPYWEKIKNTGYAKAINLAIEGLYGIEELNEDTYVDLTWKMRKVNKEGLYRWVLKERAGIELSILDDERVDVDRSLFAPVLRFEEFIMVRDYLGLKELEKICGAPIHTFTDLLRGFRAYFEKSKESIVGVKIGLAYSRPLRFEKVTFGEAEGVFNRIYSQRNFIKVWIRGHKLRTPAPLSMEETRPLQDFMVHYLIQMASKQGLPIQIHTGLQEGNANIVRNSDPTLLTNLFLEYDQARFDLFHASYPYTSEAAVLAKNFQNVYLDMCWFHVVSPYKARETLKEWLDTVPSNKILGFGGDYRFVEGVYGHSRIARRNIARVLMDSVDAGDMKLKEALKLARMLLHDNAYNLFLKGRTLT